MNEGSHLDSSGRIDHPIEAIPHRLVGVADNSAAQALDRNIDVDIKSTDKASPKLVSWREDIVAGRKRRKAPDKIQGTLHNINFELAVADANLCGFDSDESFFESHILQVVISKEIPQHLSYQKAGIVMMTYTQCINFLLSLQQHT